MMNPLYQFGPAGELRGFGPEAQFPADDEGKVLLLQHQRRFVQHRQRPVLDHAVGLDIAEHGDLSEDLLLQRFVAAQDDDVRADPHPLQFLDRVLGRLGLVLVAAPQEGHQRHMDIADVLFPLLQAHLPRCLKKRLTLDVAGGAADLRDHNIGVRLLADGVDKLLDLLGDVRDYLHGLTQVLSTPFLVQHIPVHLSRGKIRPAVEVFINEALIVSQIQIGLRAVLRHIDLTMLVGAHGSWIHIDVGVQLLCRDLQPSGLQQPAEGRRRDAFSESGYHAAGYKNILRHGVPSFPDFRSSKNSL